MSSVATILRFGVIETLGLRSILSSVCSSQVLLSDVSEAIHERAMEMALSRCIKLKLLYCLLNLLYIFVIGFEDDLSRQ